MMPVMHSREWWAKHKAKMERNVLELKLVVSPAPSSSERSVIKPVANGDILQKTVEFDGLETGPRESKTLRTSAPYTLGRSTLYDQPTSERPNTLPDRSYNGTTGEQINEQHSSEEAPPQTCFSKEKLGALHSEASYARKLIAGPKETYKAKEQKVYHPLRGTAPSPTPLRSNGYSAPSRQASGNGDKQNKMFDSSAYFAPGGGS
jgi:hypothetical protein